MADRIGQQIGNYRIIRLLGEGGFADVYLGEHLHLGTEAAIKILHTQLASDDIEQFRAEARIIARLEHPNIVRVLDFGIEGKTPYLVMSYAHNGTIRQYYPKGIPLPLASIVTFVKQIADALQYAHSQRLIHRDVKPENMLLGRRNEVLLSDFGIALVTQSSRYQGTRDVVGTVAYMAPEQIQGKPRPASDQYALGVVVYEWITGERPFHGSFTEIAVQHTVTPPPPLHEKVPTISPDVEQVVLTALAKDPQARFSSVQAFSNALEQACLPRQYRSFTPEHQISQSFIRTIQIDQRLENTIAATSPVSPQQPPILTPQPDELPPSKRRISRRMVLAGIAGVALAGGGLTWLALSQKPGSTIGSHPSATSTPVLQSTKPTISPSPTSTNAPTATPAPISTPLGTRFYTYRGHSGYIYGVTWASLDGQRVASASLDTSVQVWNAGTGDRYFIYNHSQAVNDVKASYDKTHIASAGQDNIVQVRDATTGSFISSYNNHSGAVNTVEWQPGNSAHIVSASSDKTVQIWDATNGATIQVLRGHTDTVWAAGWSPNGQYIISASADGTARIWDASTGNTLVTYTGHTATVRSVSWSPDGQRIATASEDQTVKVWDAFTGNTLLTYTGHTDLLRTVAWSHDGTRIVSGGRDATARIWDAATGTTIYVYHGHSATVFDAQWSPNGTRIASGSTDTTVQIWQAT